MAGRPISDSALDGVQDGALDLTPARTAQAGPPTRALGADTTTRAAAPAAAPAIAPAVVPAVVPAIAPSATPAAARDCRNPVAHDSHRQQGWSCPTIGPCQHWDEP
ncbi:hypothetical protein GCM10009760_54890 [Kitasatospora kazusensis]|uniref:Uncharacterized protein n=1 Tax=Kitasatospora kazusensis TaxID=407974 RepID=A0ABP5LW69_9ACTN